MSSWGSSGSSRRSGSGGILDMIPGYRGYREKESRRDQDKRVRVELARRYDLLARRLTDVQGELVRNQRFSEIAPVQQLEQSLRLFTDRLKTATYGYGGLFGERSIDERALDQIAAFDTALGDGIDELKASIESISAAIFGTGDLAQTIRATGTLIDNLNRRFDLRSQAIDSGQAQSDEAVSDVFKSGTAEQAHVGDDLHFGDAVSVGGTDYLVRGRMEFHTGDLAWRQYLLRDGSNERWLHVPPTTAEPMALLNGASTTPGEGESVTVDGQTYQQQESGDATAEVIGESGKQAGRAVRFRRFAGDAGALLFVYDWGAEQQTLVGHTLDPLEIKVFSNS